MMSTTWNPECPLNEEVAREEKKRTLEMRAFGPVWYCARTKPKHEHVAAANLSRQLGLEVFHPRLRLERATCRGVVRVVEPVFPCYVFVRCVLGEHLDQIRYINGVSSLVQFGLRIPIVPDHTIEELKLSFQSSEPLSVDDALQPGTEVTVAEGPLMGSQAVVVRMLPAKRRVQILLDFLGRTTIAEVDRDWLNVENRSMADLIPQLAMAPEEALASAQSRNSLTGVHAFA
jgi:transcriptional antiterminator RfaH